MPDTEIPAQRRVENDEYAAMLGRMIDAYGRRLAEADPYDLADLLGLHERIDSAAAVAVAGQREAGYSWQDVGDGAGFTRQAAWERWGKPERESKRGR